MSLIDVIIYTIGNGVAFNVVLPIFAVVIEILKILGLN